MLTARTASEGHRSPNPETSTGIASLRYMARRHAPTVSGVIGYLISNGERGN